jgi:hypothetical protein
MNLINDLIPQTWLPMSASHTDLTDPPFTSITAIAILSAKRNELDRKREELMAELAEIDKSLAHIDGAIDILESKDHHPLPSPQAKTFSLKDLKFGRGELGKLAVTVLIEACTPLTTQLIAKAIIAQRNITISQEHFICFCRALGSTLRRLEVRGLASEVGRGPYDAVLWRASS